MNLVKYVKICQVTGCFEAETIEEKIIELQEKKQTVFDCTVGNSNQALPAVPVPGGVVMCSQ